MEKPRGAFRGNIRARPTCLLQRKAKRMPGDWAQDCRDIYFLKCGPVRCSVRNVRLSLQASARSRNLTLIWLNGITENMKDSLPPKFTPNVRIGNSFGTAAPEENRR